MIHSSVVFIVWSFPSTWIITGLTLSHTHGSLRWVKTLENHLSGPLRHKVYTSLLSFSWTRGLVRSRLKKNPPLSPSRWKSYHKEKRQNLKELKEDRWQKVRTLPQANWKWVAKSTHPCEKEQKNWEKKKEIV